ncbi:MAG: D-ribose pyranase [Ignavibacteriales bacterium]|nr:D-ribose pyranase [Ignavibacteriales bacterium]
MKKIGTLNSHLSLVIARMGHTDRLVICDSGFPIPRGTEMVDLALTKNVPSFIESVKVVLEELQVEGAVIAKEMQQMNKRCYDLLLKEMNSANVNSLKKVSHEELKKLTANGGNIAFVRTGEATPYANVILIAGVTFD